MGAQTCTNMNVSSLNRYCLAQKQSLIGQYLADHQKTNHHSELIIITKSEKINPKYAQQIESHSKLTSAAQKVKEQNIQQIPKIRQNQILFISQYQASYRGSFKKGIPHGVGEIHFKDGSYYAGQMKYGQAHGQGIYIFSNGSLFKGNFKSSRFHGQGKLSTLNQQFVYIGNLLNGKPHGKGKQSLKNGKYSYQGQYRKGIKQGYGVYIWGDGKKYEGYFMQGLMHGKGTLYYQNGQTIFDGQFRYGRKQGYGILTSQYGSYQGKFTNDHLNGCGTFIWKDGKVFEGQFENSKKNGEGFIYYLSGQYAHGIWAQDHNISLQEVKYSVQVFKKIEQIKKRHLMNRRQPTKTYNQTFYQPQKYNFNLY